MKNRILITLFALLMTVVSIYGFYHIDKNLKASFLTGEATRLEENTKQQVKNFYKSDAEIKTVFLIQDSSLISDQRNKSLLSAAYTLLKNLDNQADYRRFVVIYDQEYINSGTDLIAPEIEHRFPQAEIIFPKLNAQMTESEIYSLLKPLQGEGTVFIIQTFYEKNTLDPLLAEIQATHFKNAFDNFTKASLDSLTFSNREAIKAVYQLNKDHQNLKTLPALEDIEHGFTLKYVVHGPRHQSGIFVMTTMGDLMLGRFVRTLMDKNGLDYPFENLDQSFLRGNDLLLANLEGPIAENKINTSKAIAFRFMPDIAPLLKKYHFDALSMANNHALDMGDQGLLDSYRFLEEQNIIAFGHPKNIERELKTEINGFKLAMLGLNDIAYKLDREATLKRIDELAAEGYQVMPVVHWGIEYQHKPQDKDVEFAHEMIDHGAIAVIGHHPHVVQSLEIYKEKPIFYSLGNAVFDQYFSADTQEGLASSLVISADKIELYLLPLKIEQSQVRLMNVDERNAFLTRFVEYWRYDQIIKAQILQGKITLQIEKPLLNE